MENEKNEQNHQCLYHHSRMLKQIKCALIIEHVNAAVLFIIHQQTLMSTDTDANQTFQTDGIIPMSNTISFYLDVSFKELP